MLINLTKAELCWSAGLDIPVRDVEAWVKYPKHRWIYNKLELALALGIAAAPMGVPPTSYPVMVKPIINLHGMGAMAEQVDDAARHERALEQGAGRFWMTLFEGPHISLDIVLHQGRVMWYCAWQGYPTRPWSGAFDYWETRPDYVLPRLGLLDHLHDFTGVVNVELIDNKPIEAHLRMGDLHLFGSVQLFRQIGQALEGNPMDWPIPPLAAVPVFQPADAVQGDMKHLDLDTLCQCRLLYVDSLTSASNPMNFTRRALLVGRLDVCLRSRQRLLTALEE